MHRNFRHDAASATTRASSFQKHSGSAVRFSFVAGEGQLDQSERLTTPAKLVGFSNSAHLPELSQIAGGTRSPPNFRHDAVRATLGALAHRRSWTSANVTRRWHGRDEFSRPDASRRETARSRFTPTVATDQRGESGAGGRVAVPQRGRRIRLSAGARTVDEPANQRSAGDGRRSQG